ncbi:MAG: DNA repair protein RadA [Chloroflexi bacterium HGW-Chloroflexi-1]|nr:MAG: DNA repair protein RadA [Chloroflexi bacterium HGW-Chloroflexi-1]
MVKTKTRYVCQTCGSAQAKWMGKCPDCGEWNTLVEMVVHEPAPGRAASLVAGAPTAPQALPDIPADGYERIPVPIGELSRVLGGGIVPGSVVLISGDPGIGKSTLLTQICAALAEDGGPVLYVSGEESAAQIKLRAERLGIVTPHVLVLADTHLESVMAHIEKIQPRLVVVDSVQSIYSDAIPSGAGSVTQVRDCSAQLLRLAKTQTFPLFLVGHVTKEGAIAGPRVLEHMVDTVLYLEGERFHSFRLLRSVKNRFGSTNEVGVFEMAESGLVEVRNPSEAFLAERLPNSAGSAIAVTMEGTRPILVEVQALTSATSFAQPRRTANGVDFNRLLLLTAVLGKRARVRLADQDVFVNVVGGLEVDEPAADLAIAAAIASSVRNRPVAADLALVGEVGLSGELRSVGQLPRRLNEAAKLGFTRVLVPKTAARKLDHPPDGVQVLGARTLREALELALMPGEASDQNG